MFICLGLMPTKNPLFAIVTVQIAVELLVVM